MGIKRSLDKEGYKVKRKVYQDVSASKVVIRDAKHFAEYSDQATNIKVEYLDKSDIVVNDLSDAVEVKGLQRYTTSYQPISNKFFL